MAYFLLTLLFIILGAYSIAAQIYFIRELLVVFFGNELCLGIIFGGWFAGIGMGALIGGRTIIKKYHSIYILLISIVVISILPFILVPIIRMLRTILEVPVGGYASMARISAGTLISICPFSLLIGFVFPVACRVLMERKEKGSIDIGWVYIWESAGSLAGGLTVSFLLIPEIPPLVVFGWGSLMIFLVSFALVCKVNNRPAYNAGRRSRYLRGRLENALKGQFSRGTTVPIVEFFMDPSPKARVFVKTIKKVHQVFKLLLLVLSMTCAIVIASGILYELDEYMIGVRWKTFNTGLKLIESRDSRYQNIVLSEAQDQFDIFVNGNLSGVYPDEYQSALKAHFFLSEHPHPERVLLIGGGITGLLREILKHPVKLLDYVEFDPELVKIIYPFLKADDRKAVEDRRVTILHIDGRRYVKEAKKKYDLIIVETPDPSTALLNRFYTVDFFKEVRKTLSAKGVFVIGMSSTENYVSNEVADYNGSLYRGILNVFPFVMAVPGERNYYFAGTQHGLFSKDPDILVKRYEERNIDSKIFSPVLFKWLLQIDRIDFLENALKRKDDVPINTDFHPITYFYNIIIWNIFSGEKYWADIFQTLKGKSIWWVFIAGAILFLAYIAFLTKRPKNMIRFNCLFSIFTTGCAGMALEIVLIFMFQSLYGYIYEKIGIVVSLFMFGIAIGSHIMRNRLEKKSFIKLETLVLLEVIMAIYVTSVPFMLSFISEAVSARAGFFFFTEYLFYAIIFAIALLAGMEFPLTCHLIIESGYESGSVAGWVDSMDHIGACFGAFFPAIIILPFFGTPVTCFIMGFLKLIAVALLFMNLKLMASKKVQLLR